MRSHLLELPPTYDDAELVRAALERARQADEREDREARDGVPELVRAAFATVGAGIALVALAFAIRWYASLSPGVRLQGLCAALLLLGAAWLIHECVQADWLDCVPRPRLGHFPHRPDEGKIPAAPLGDGDRGGLVEADVRPSQVGGRPSPNAALECGGMGRTRTGLVD